ncbi:Apple-like protein [Artemisia annua]|uniref:Apple-like protein n=1 Tax=Artemisia annua TaxID=35608 RepID=A0A2U1KND0_ARTAN|nr:Apple-like protein [Artemisia annua]
MPSLKPNPIFTFGYNSNDIETYASFYLINSSVLTKMKLKKDKKLSGKTRSLTIIAIPVSVGLAILLGLCVLIVKNKRKQKAMAQVIAPVFVPTQDTIEQKGEIQLPVFSLSTLLVATDNFSPNNKLGEGGFGPVYKVLYNLES